MQNLGLGKKRRELQAPLIVDLRDFDAHAEVRQLLGKIIRDVPAADDQDRPHARRGELDLVEKRLRVADGRNERDAVARLQPERARGNIDLLLAALDRADQDLGLHEARKLHERLARDKGVLRDLHL